MKLLSSKKEILLNAVGKVINLVERKQTLPILSNVVLQKNTQGKLQLLSSDAQMQVAVDTEISWLADFNAITVGARVFYDALRSLADASEFTVNINENQKLELLGLNTRFQLQTIAAVNYPFIESSDTIQGQVKIASKSLLEAITLVHISVAAHELRYYLNGMSIKIEEGQIEFAGTDSHRLSVYTYAHDDKQSKAEFIIPRKVIMELQRLLSDVAEEDVEIAYATNSMTLKAKNLLLYSKLIEGKFPDYQKIMPKNHTFSASVSRKALQTAIQRCIVVHSDDRFKSVYIQFTENQLLIRSTNLDQEQVNDQIDVNYQGEDMEVCFNAQYLLDFVNACTSDNLLIHLRDNSSSIVFAAQDIANYTYVLMPMRMS